MRAKTAARSFVAGIAIRIVATIIVTIAGKGTRHGVRNTITGGTITRSGTREMRRTTRFGLHHFEVVRGK